MSKNKELVINNSWVVSKRGKKNFVDSQKPYAWLIEKERTPSGRIEDVATIFLTNKECPFNCLMCDLWKNTTDVSVPLGAIPNQIEWVLNKMTKVKHLKLYNSGNFFDKKAIPEEDYSQIASLINRFETVVVESHPKLINKKLLRFRDMIKPELQVALGLETVHREILKKLNKQMTLDNFKTAVDFLNQNGISSRAFVLLKPPFMSEPEAVYWAKKSIDFAFNIGVECCVIIPVRSGNGAVDWLTKKGDFSLPNISSLETVLEYGIKLKAGRVFADVWDLHIFSKCKKCISQRTKRLININLNQSLVNKVICNCDN